MKIFLTLFTIAVFHFNSVSQTVSYVMPESFKDAISQEDYEIIAKQSLSVVSSRYQVDNLANGTITITGRQAFNLDNLVPKCAAEKDRTKWEGIIQDHFKSLFNSFDAKKKLNTTDYDYIRSYLSIRIYPDATIEQRGGTANFITRIDLDGTTTILMLDLPQAFTPVLKDDFNMWHKTIDEVFKEAIANVDKQKVEKATKVFTTDGSQIEFNFMENENYAASYALDLSNNSPEFVGEWGSVVVVPDKGLVSICKISKNKPVDFVKYIQQIKPLIERSYTQHESPVSKEFFWYYEGKFTHIPVSVDDKGNVNVVAPSGLSNLMTVKK
ncbi:MAG TPA: hypothetical protein VGN20_03515 [Mucilaginibacter sp.]|jgi:hypothetical protein